MDKIFKPVRFDVTGYLYLQAHHICLFVPIHKSILGTNYVSNAKISNFSQGQANQKIPRPAL